MPETKASKAEKRKLAVSLVYLDKLKKTREQRALAVDSIEAKIRTILTPVQQARYLTWVEENREKLRLCGFEKGVAPGWIYPF